MRGFKDPMSRQLSEAVRIELRGGSILNSRSEYTRCRVPRLRIDLEGWKLEQKKSSIQKEDPLVTEAESSLEDQDDRKRKSREEAGDQGRSKTKRLRLEKLTGWGEETDEYEREPLPDGGWDSISSKDTMINNQVGINITNSVVETKQCKLPAGWILENTTIGEENISKEFENVKEPFRPIMKRKDPPVKLNSRREES